MIASVTGTLLRKSPTEIVVDVQGIGYGITIPLSTYEALGAERSRVTVLTYLHVREDALQLFGFATEGEREAFRLLISVSGIGPKIAQSILSGISVAELRNHITAGNIGALSTVPGIGRKTAERLILELREKLGRLDTTERAVSEADPESRMRAEALMALTSLGYNRVIAEKALRTALQELNGTPASVEELIKSSLRHITR